MILDFIYSLVTDILNGAATSLRSLWTTIDTSIFGSTAFVSMLDELNEPALIGPCIAVVNAVVMFVTFFLAWRFIKWIIQMIRG